MKERGILLTKENRLASVRDVNPKTNTRRVIVPQPIARNNYTPTVWDWKNGLSWFENNIIPEAVLKEACYQVGDHLYMKEPIFVHFGGRHWGKEIGTQFGYQENPEKSLRTVHVAYDYAHSYRDASRMPKYAARYWFKVMGVRCERNDEGLWVWVYEYKRITI